MPASAFTDTIASEAELRALLGEPSALVIRKQLPALDRHCRAFIALAPFVAVGTVSADGRSDVSPRGDAPGFVRVLDERTLVIPERPGNRRFDTLRNILQTGTIGLFFIIPGIEETLRVNGRAVLVRDAELLDSLTAQGKAPWLAITVTVEEAFLHCAKALKRSRLWDTTTWPERAALPSLAKMLHDQTHPTSATVADLEESIAESYAKRLY
ncbi:MAG: pyridoxamine 5'-phosphate oxidase family protein [Thermomicrobiales bacterium]